MRKVKPDSSSDTASQRMRPAITPEYLQLNYGMKRMNSSSIQRNKNYS